MQNKTIPKLTVKWWIFILLWFVIFGPLTIVAVNLISNKVTFSDKMASWPTVKGKPDWNLVQFSGSTSGFKSGGWTGLACKYTYEVNGVIYKNDDLQLDSDYINIKGKKVELSYADFKRKFKGKYEDDNKGYLKENGKLIGRDYENADGTVTVYYCPDDPATSVIIPGKGGSSYTKIIGIMVPALLTFLILMLQPISVISYKMKKHE